MNAPHPRMGRRLPSDSEEVITDDGYWFDLWHLLADQLSTRAFRAYLGGRFVEATKLALRKDRARARMRAAVERMRMKGARRR
jgi:hypothetical protein